MIRHLLAPAVAELELDADAAALLEEVAEVARAVASDQAVGLGDVLVAGARALSSLEGHLHGLRRRFASSLEWQADGTRSAGGWLATNTGISSGNAGCRLKVAEELVDCPHIEAGAKSARLTDDKVRLMLSFRKPDLVEIFAACEADLVAGVALRTYQQARDFLREWELEVRTLLGINVPEAGDPERKPNWLRLRQLLDGMHVVDGELGSVAAATLANAIEAQIKAWREAGELDGDHRSMSELWADALIHLVSKGAEATMPGRGHLIALLDYDTLVERAAGRSGAPGPWGDAAEAAAQASTGDGADDGEGDGAAAEPPTTCGCPNEHAPEPHLRPDATGSVSTGGGRMPFRSQLLGAEPVSPAVLRQMACNADITPVILRQSQALHVGRSARLATPAIRSAVWARARGVCELCHHTKLTWCQIHHIQWWEHGGETSVDNSVLACTRCHTLIHQRGWTVHHHEDGRFRLHRPDGTVARGPSDAPRPPGWAA